MFEKSVSSELMSWSLADVPMKALQNFPVPPRYKIILKRIPPGEIFRSHHLLELLGVEWTADSQLIRCWASRAMILPSIDLYIVNNIWLEVLNLLSFCKIRYLLPLSELNESVKVEKMWTYTLRKGRIEQQFLCSYLPSLHFQRC